MIELTVYGDPAACRSAAQSGLRIARSVEEFAATAGRTTCDSWTGLAGEGFRSAASGVDRALSDIADRLRPACRALEDVAGEIEVVKSRLGEARSIAAGAGLSLSGDTIHPPTEGSGPMTPTQVQAHNARVQAYNQAFDIAEGARSKEREAHGRAVSAMRASNGDGLVEDLLERLGLAPGDGMDSYAGAAYVFGLAGTAFGPLAGWMANGVLGTWQPKFRDAHGRWVWGTNKGWSRWDRLTLSLRKGARGRDFRALPHQAASRGRWLTASTWAGRAGGVATALSSGWSQWQADADDPSLDTDDRVDRAATTGVSTAAGAWAGAQGGAYLGGAIGTAICPGAGTVIGGAVGGLVGGAIGAYAGSELADVVNEEWDGAVHMVGESVSDAGQAIGEGLSDAGDALTFWD